jgi:hypothetical protein
MSATQTAIQSLSEAVSSALDLIQALFQENSSNTAVLAAAQKTISDIKLADATADAENAAALDKIKAQLSAVATQALAAMPAPVMPTVVTETPTEQTEMKPE